MSTSGLYGFRKNDIDKVTYNHANSYPDGLGYEVIEFCMNHSISELNKIYDGLMLVNKNSIPTPEQVDYYYGNGWHEGLSEDEKRKINWDDIVWNFRLSDFDVLDSICKENRVLHMIDNHDFILYSLCCEYAYIVNLDKNVLEFYRGFQEEADPTNRYGTKPNSGGYYPCKLLAEIPLDEINSKSDINKIVHFLSNTDENTYKIYVCDEEGPFDQPPYEDEKNNLSYTTKVNDITNRRIATGTVIDNFFIDGKEYLIIEEKC